MSKLLSRRSVLRGAGVALALPWLEAFSPERAHAQATAPAKRFLTVYMPNGASTLWWKTTGRGSGDAWQLSPLLAPLAPVKSKMVLVRQLGNFTWRRDLLTLNPAWTTFRERNDFCGVCRMPAGAFVTPSHSRDPAAMLNCIDGDAYRQGRGQDVRSSPANGETIDQLVARSLTKSTPLASMQLGLFNGNGGLDERHSALSRNMSWSNAGTPLGKDLEPRVIFDKLVAAGAGGSDSDPAAAEAAARRRALDTSALDALAESTTQLKGRLGRGDQERLDDFLTGVRELELKIKNVGEMPTASGAECEAVQLPADVSQPLVRAGVMNDLIVMALACGVTRVATYMLDNSRSDLVYSWVKRRDFEKDGAEVGGTATAYHESQHHTGTSPDFASITHWHVERVADLVQKLDRVKEGERTLLDNSLVVFLSDMHHGDHALFDLPFAMFGGAGTFRQNELVMLPEGIDDIRQLRDVYFTIANNYLGLNLASFGDDMRGVPNQVISELLV
ncbi:MAG TPA: DUF1552 domain-containing protein [Polyangiaceae bacterium]